MERDTELAPEQRDGRPVEERTAGSPESTPAPAASDDDDIPEDETIESVGY
jgi:hypothetical protein